MNLSDDERRIVVGLEYEKAQTIFGQIEGLRGLGYWDIIANRLYFSVFHAVAALLIHDGHKVNTHRGVMSVFGQYYIRTGLLPSVFGRLYSDLQIMRNNSDYNCSYSTTREEIEPLIDSASLLIDKIGEMIR